MSIGQALAEARHRVGLTVAEVSRRTRIREAIIRDIENDNYSTCGGDFYARGHIRSIAEAAGVDPDPLLREYDVTHGAPHAATLEDLFASAAGQVTEPIPVTEAAPGTLARTRKRRWLNMAAALALLAALVAVPGWVAYHRLSSTHRVAGRVPPAQAHRVTHHRLSPNGPATAAAPARRTAGARTLTPASAAVFGPDGVGQGDNPQLAPLAIDHNRVTAWHTDWYTTAHFGSLYRGTGLLLDMRHQVVITAAQIILGSAPGATLQLRAGPVPTLADLRPAARAVNTGGVIRLRFTTPARGRYVLIWFTSLPRGPTGTFRVSVHDIRLEGLS